ncbi:MAG: peptidogalycan biosysnthesis protein, partial [Gemmatimonadales bacterium]
IEPGSEALVRVGRERGYAEVYAGATARLRVRWDGFDGYLASRSKNLRRTIREDLKALDATGARLTSSSEFQREAGAMDRLYRRAYRRRNRCESPLARDFFHRLAETPSPDVVAQLTWRGARLVGISLNLPTPGLQDGTFAAFEEGDRGGPAYYNDLVYEPLRRACREHVAALDLGPTALYPKVLRGAVLRPRTTLVRGTTPLAHRALRALGGLVSRRQEWKERRALGRLWGPRCFEEAE